MAFMFFTTSYSVHSRRIAWQRDDIDEIRTSIDLDEVRAKLRIDYSRQVPPLSRYRSLLTIMRICSSSLSMLTLL